jgi:hypothetical protein
MLRFAVRTLVVTSVLALLGSSSGCNKNDRPAMAPVSGVVTYQGRPLEGATVVFRNDKSPQFGIGKTDKEGRYRLTTYENFDGATLGEHQVSVSKQQANPELAGANVEKPSAAYGQGMMAAASGDTSKIAKDELPAKFGNPATSGLRATVKQGEKNEFNFQLD